MIGRTLSFEAPSNPDDPRFQIKRDELDEKQEDILEHLKIINKFKSDPIYSLSIFQMHFFDYLEGKPTPFTDYIFKTWDNMKYEGRIEVSIKFLEEGKR